VTGGVQAFAVACAWLAAAFGVRVLPQGHAPLEPSVQNEVDHAVSRAERWLAQRPERGVCRAAAGTDRFFPTNGRTRAEIALALVSSQRGDGWWITPTNTAPTRAAIRILKGL
jgi:hypothetical protein